jgi:predicted aconitase
MLHPGLYRGDPETAANARALMDAYVTMGCRPTWTCAPYQLPQRPAFGEQIAWAESNAIVFANSVLGARTQRYGDFIDICAALTGRVPDAGLHRSENRRGQVVFQVSGLPSRLLDEDVLYPVLGHVIGKRAGTRIPVLDGLPAGLSEDRLKALGAAAASSGAVALFHAVGSTPEAGTLADALQGGEAEELIPLDAALVRAARDELSTVDGGVLTAVSIGTPHFSLAEFERLMPLLDGFRTAASVTFYVSTGRDTLAVVRERGWVRPIEEAGITIVVDTCTYITPILPRTGGVVMTNSAKWAYYAPGNLGVDVVFGSIEECVRSAEAGRVRRDPALWEGV